MKCRNQDLLPSAKAQKSPPSFQRAGQGEEWWEELGSELLAAKEWQGMQAGHSKEKVKYDESID